MCADSLPKVGRRPLNMMALYREVGLRGGFHKVEEQKGWKRIGSFGPPKPLGWSGLVSCVSCAGL